MILPNNLHVMIRRYHVSLVILIAAAFMTVQLSFASPLRAQTPEPCNETTGSVERQHYHSERRGQDFIFSIYLPPCYEKTKTVYPVLYLLHGTDEDDRLWLDLGLQQTLEDDLKSGTVKPMIVVMPNGSDLAELNSFDDQSWAGVFVNELMPYVEKHYRVATKTAQRAIGGISRGGFWAYHIALMNPSLFSAVGGHSAVFTPNYVPPKYNPIWLVVTAKNTEKIRFWLDRAALDVSGPTMNTMAATMQTHKLNLTYKVYKNGNHNNAYWTSHLEAYIAFYSADW